MKKLLILALLTIGMVSCSEPDPVETAPIEETIDPMYKGKLYINGSSGDFTVITKNGEPLPYCTDYPNIGYKFVLCEVESGDVIVFKDEIQPHYHLGEYYMYTNNNTGQQYIVETKPAYYTYTYPYCLIMYDGVKVVDIPQTGEPIEVTYIVP